MDRRRIIAISALLFTAAGPTFADELPWCHEIGNPKPDHNCIDYFHTPNSGNAVSTSQTTDLNAVRNTNAFDQAYESYETSPAANYGATVGKAIRKKAEKREREASNRQYRGIDASGNECFSNSAEILDGYCKINSSSPTESQGATSRQTTSTAGPTRSTRKATRTSTTNGACSDPMSGWRGDPNDHRRFHCAQACLPGQNRTAACQILAKWDRHNAHLGSNAFGQCNYCGGTSATTQRNTRSEKSYAVKPRSYDRPTQSRSTTRRRTTSSQRQTMTTSGPQFGEIPTKVCCIGLFCTPEYCSRTGGKVHGPLFDGSEPARRKFGWGVPANQHQKAIEQLRRNYKPNVLPRNYGRTMDQ